MSDVSLLSDILDVLIEIRNDQRGETTEAFNGARHFGIRKKEDKRWMFYYDDVLISYPLRSMAQAHLNRMMMWNEGQRPEDFYEVAEFEQDKD